MQRVCPQPGQTLGTFSAELKATQQIWQFRQQSIVYIKEIIIKSPKKSLL